MNRTLPGPLAVSISQAIFALPFFVFFLVIFNGYLLNLHGGGANAWWILCGVLIEGIAIVWLLRPFIRVRFDPYELAGFLVVVGGVWLYFIAAAWPTLLPPTQSMDAVRHYEHVVFSFPEGRLVGWYPAGGSLIAATLAHWLGWAPLRILHPVAAAFVALSAGAVYGITCALLPPKRLSLFAALLAPALLFVPWSYFAGMIDAEQYFYAQAVAQYFVLAALWFTTSYAARPHWIWVALIAAALLGIMAAYPYLVGLALLCAFVVILGRTINPWQVPQLGSGTDAVRKGRLLTPLLTFASLLVLMGVTAVVLQRTGIADLRGAQVSAVSGVGEGGVTNPSLATLGGPLFLLLALLGLVVAWRRGAVGRALIGFLFAWLVQLIGLYLAQSYLPISGYRVDKTFYILPFVLAIFAGTAVALGIDQLVERARRSFALKGQRMAAAWLGTVILLGLAVALLRPPVRFSPLTESELQAALWARDHLDTYQISYLGAKPISAYWLAMGLWQETLPNDWFQWMPEGIKLGPASLDEWFRNPAWPRWVLVSDVRQANALGSVQIAYQNGSAAILEKQASNGPTPAAVHPAMWQFGSTIRLLGYNLEPSSPLPGTLITLTTVTESMRPPPATVAWRVELVDRAGNVISKATGGPFGDRYPLQRWPPGRTSQDVWHLLLDPKMLPGSYDLRIGLYQSSDGQGVRVWPVNAATGTVEQGGQAFSAVPLTKIKIPVPPPSSAELQAATPLQARIGDNFALAKYKMDWSGATRILSLTLYWECITKTNSDYTIFVHVLDASGKVIAQVDSPPREGSYPTSLWDKGELVKDSYNLSIPADGQAPYSIEIGMYSYPSLQRLPVGATDHILINPGF